jgi:hypothetical protein
VTLAGPSGGLSWYRKNVDWIDHPKVLELLAMRDGFRALVVWDASISYATWHGTDGLIRPSVLPRIHGRKVDADRLVKVTLWDPHPEGWTVHDFADYQQLSQVTATIRTARSIAGSKGMCRRWHGPNCGCWARTGPLTL